MKYDLSTPATKLDGAAMTNAEGDPLNVRGVLALALDSQPTETDARGVRQQRPVTMAEVRTRLAIEGKFPAVAAQDQTAEFEAEDVTLLQQLVLDSLPTPVGKFIVRFFSTPAT